MSTNITTATFKSGETQAYAGALYQYDYGQYLKLEGVDLPSSYEVHFSNYKEQGTSKTSIGDEDGVFIPDEFLTSGYDVYAWFFLHTGNDDGETVYQVIIPVNKRAQPSGDQPTPVERSIIEQAIAALNTAVAQTGEDVQTTNANASAAANSAAAAVASETNAAGSARSAAGSAQSAGTSAENAATSETNAGNSADAAAGSAEDAEGSAQRAAESEETVRTMAQMVFMDADGYFHVNINE